MPPLASVPPRPVHPPFDAGVDGALDRPAGPALGTPALETTGARA